MTAPATDSAQVPAKEGKSFLDSLTTTVWDKVILALVVTALSSGISNVMNRDALKEAKASAERAATVAKARTEFESAFALVKQISNSKNEIHPEDQKVYMSLLEHLQQKAGFDAELKSQLDGYIGAIERQKTAEVDPNPVASTKDGQIVQVNAPNSEVDLNSIPKDALPLRLYIQIGSEEQRPTYEKIAGKLSAFVRVKVPPVALISEDRKIPKVSNIRYCPNSTPAQLALAMEVQLKMLVSPVNLYRLPDRLCGAVRQNHLELWLSKDAK